LETKAKKRRTSIKEEEGGLEEVVETIDSEGQYDIKKGGYQGSVPEGTLQQTT